MVKIAQIGCKNVQLTVTNCKLLPIRMIIAQKDGWKGCYLILWLLEMLLFENETHKFPQTIQWSIVAKYQANFAM